MRSKNKLQILLAISSLILIALTVIQVKMAEAYQIVHQREYMWN